MAALIAATMSGCSSDEPTGSGNDLGDTNGGSSATRSVTCLKVQNAICDWSADKCQQSDRASCEDWAKALFCKSDSVIQKCLDALPAAACNATPASCQQIANPAPAIHLCKKVSENVCSIASTCGAQDKDDCTSELATTLPCELAFGASPTIETCLSDLDATACPAPGKSPPLPASCNNVIKLNTQSVSETPGLDFSKAPFIEAPSFL